MYKVVSDKCQFAITFNYGDDTSGIVNGKPFHWDIIDYGKGSFHIIKGNKSFSAQVTEADYKEKKFIIRINGNKYSLFVRDRYDELLDTLGLKETNESKVNEIKAPMPGLVLEMMVKQGSKVKKDDPLLVLEAMKMENILKSPREGTIQSCLVSKGATVEKNEVLIAFK